MTARRLWLAALLSLVAGCALSAPEPAGDQVASWSQADDDRDWIDEVMPISPMVLASDADRQSWLDKLPGNAAADDSFDQLRSVDLRKNFIVVGGYARCTEHSVVTISGDGDVVFEVRDDDEDTLCDWSPYTIDVWAVPLELTDGKAPDGAKGETSDS